MDDHTDDTVPPVSGRRQFLRLGGAGVMAAAVLAACGEDRTAPPSETGVTEPQGDTDLAPPQTTTPEAGATQDAVVTRTTRTMELALVVAYDAVLGEGPSDLALPGALDYAPEVEETLRTLRNRHEANAETLVDLVRQADGEPVSEPNNGILEGILAPQLPSLTSQRAVLLAAGSLEALAAGTYGWGAGSIRPDAEHRPLRESLAGMAEGTARHASALSLLVDPSGASAVAAATLDTSGPARLPGHMLIGEGQDGSDALAAPAAAGEDEGDEDGAEGDEAADGEGEG